MNGLALASHRGESLGVSSLAALNSFLGECALLR
jgi:hypothetical protein